MLGRDGVPLVRWHSPRGWDCALLGFCIPQTPVLPLYPWQSLPSRSGCWPEELAPAMAQKEILSRVSVAQQGWHWPSVPAEHISPAPLCPAPPHRAGVHPTPPGNTCVTSLGQSLPIFFIDTQILSRPHPWKLRTFLQLLIFTLMGKVSKKLPQKLWIVLKEEHLCSCWIQ